MKIIIAMKPDDLTKTELHNLYRLISSINESARMLADISRPMFNGIRYISDSELANRLRVSKRTLANYRATGILGYYNVEGKVIYADCDIEDYLKDHYIPPFQ